MKGAILITGGCGFIGSHVVRLFVRKYPDVPIINADKLTYAGNLANLRDIECAPNYRFEKVDISDWEPVRSLFSKYAITGVIHMAAESHVDRSISDPLTFARSNVLGTLSLLQAAKEAWNGAWGGKRFCHISTDEVYGSLEITHPEGTKLPTDAPMLRAGNPIAYGTSFFREDSPYAPHSPYSASKASSDHFVRAFRDTYGLPTLITNCSNNYGPYQFPEKLIPLCVNNVLARKAIPVYGGGENVRDWLYVEDHARAIDLVFRKGQPGQTYNIGGFNERKNMDVINAVIATADRLLGRPEGADLGLITHVTDRPGHDARYAIDSSKLQRELGWETLMPFDKGIETTVRWYLEHSDWLELVTSGAYRAYYRDMYENR